VDTETLIQTIEEILARGIRQVPLPDFVRINPLHRQLWEMSHADTSHAALTPLVSLMEKDPDLRRFERGWMRLGWGGGGSISLFAIADWLVADANLNGARTTATAFERFVQSNEATAYTVLAVRGITVTEPVELLESVTLQPLNSLPPSYGQVVLAQVISGLHPFGHPDIPANAAAIVFKDPTFSPVVTPSIIPIPASPEDMDKLTHRAETLADVLRCLTIVGPCSPVAIGTWTQLIGHGVPMTGGGGYGYNHETAFARPVTMGPFDAEEAQAVIKAFYARLPAVRRDLRIPLDRLNRAIRGNSLADQAIDLGIALEAILFHGSGETDELAFRLSLRGAWLGASSEVDRFEQYRLLRRLYRLRSKAVHTGELSNSKAEQQRKLLKCGFHLCSILLKRIITEGKWPASSGEWDQLVLGFQ